MILAGENVTVRITGDAITNVPDFVTPLTVARIAALTFEATACVVTDTDAFTAPAGIVRVAGTLASATDELRTTTTPPAGAGASIEIVATEDFPPATDVGKSVTETGAGPRTISDVVTVTPLFVALSVAVALYAIGAVEITKFALVAPEATEIVVGTVAEL